MLSTSPSIFLASSALWSAVQAQPHGHTHQHATSKRATGVVTGRGIVYADSNTGMGALGGKVSWSTDWTPWEDNPTNADLGSFAPTVWGLNNADGDPRYQFLSAFLAAASTFPDGSTIIGFNEPEQVTESWMTPQAAVDNWSGINDLKTSKKAKVCTPCVSNGANKGTSGTGTVTGQYQSGIDQGIYWMTEFLAAAQGQYEFDCLCMHFYGGQQNSLEADQSMLASQVGAMAALASQYHISDIVISEMQRLNGDQECEFVSWLQDTFLTDSQYADSGNKVTAYSYNYNAATLMSGDSLTAVGSAYIGEGSC